MKIKSTIFTKINNLLIGIRVAQLNDNKKEEKLLDKELFKIQEKLKEKLWG